MFEAHPSIKNNRALHWAGYIQLTYGLFELIETLLVGLISVGVIPNLYILFVSVDTEVGRFMETMPVIFIPIFAFITSLRLLSG
ncbi:MAG: hypothetical protein ACFFER_06385 [Candidatus Thorarchaeota archaeon]